MDKMNDKILYKGTRWYKCDLHLHTTASLCFPDKFITAEQWIEKAVERGLDCVAVTDHNTGISVDNIKNAASQRGITVFPSVELTCDSSKVHLLIIFDVDKTSDDIRDFLVRANIRAEDFGKKDVASTKSIFEIAELAKTDGAIVIPAHIDEYNGLGSISVGNLEKFYMDYNINAVQVVHREFLNSSLQTTGNTELKSLLNKYYNNPTPVIDDATVKEWFTPVKYALKNDLAILTFSDNPREIQSSEHGLWGIGSHYTWIKMDEIPSLEGLRQAFLLPKYRIKNKFDCHSNPYTKPDLWIKSISISNTTITDATTPLKIDFSPQLNTLIGGRGSGKSSILRFIRGVFNKTIDLTDLNEILNDHNEFYKRETAKSKKGVLTDSSKIEIEFIRNGILHKIVASNITNSSSRTIQIERLTETNTWENVFDEGYIDFFEFEQYSQKQIYEIAQEPNSLRERIDKAIDGLGEIKVDRERTRRLFLEKSAAIRTIDLLLVEKGKTETRIKDLEANIKKLQQSGIANLLTTNEKFSNENNLIKTFQLDIEKRVRQLSEFAQSIEMSNIDLSAFDEKYKEIFEQYAKNISDSFSKIKTDILRLSEEAGQIKANFETFINNSLWKTDLDKNMTELNLKKEELEKDGMDAISSFEKFVKEKIKLERELEEINAKTIIREENKNERERLQNEYLSLSKEITNKRREFVQSILTRDKVKVNINPFRNRTDYETQLRKFIQRENASFQSDIDALLEICFKGNVEQTIKSVRSVFLGIKANKDVSDIVSGYFVNLVKSLSEAQIDEIELMLPEDEIEVQYKPTSTTAFKSLSTASAGQKTSAILTFILSYGKLPLILDQPEDDLDNRLIYELIVDRLKQAKENRQLIVVTHNANIPVNGDAEYVISMDSESKTLKVLHTGTIEQIPIKKEICDVMEGGELAFEMRTKRYKTIK